MKKVMRYIIGFVIAAVITALVISNTGCAGDDTTINDTKVVYTCSTNGKCDNPKRKSPPSGCACVTACTCEAKKFKGGKK